MNLLAWIKNYEKVILKKIQFDIKAWAKNYKEKILEPRILQQEINRLRKLEETYHREQRKRIYQLRQQQNKIRIKQQRQEFEALVKYRLEERSRNIPLYCAAPSGGAFDIDEPVADKGWMSVEPRNNWLTMFGRQSRNHINLVDNGEELFMSMKDNVDDGFFEE